MRKLIAELLLIIIVIVGISIMNLAIGFEETVICVLAVIYSQQILGGEK